jgi:hypothetical protein
MSGGLQVPPLTLHCPPTQRHLASNDPHGGHDGPAQVHEVSSGSEQGSPSVGALVGHSALPPVGSGFPGTNEHPSIAAPTAVTTNAARNTLLRFMGFSCSRCVPRGGRLRSHEATFDRP